MSNAPCLRIIFLPYISIAEWGDCGRRYQIFAAGEAAAI